MKVMIQSVHKYNPRFDDVEGPFEASAEDFATLENARRWFKKHRISLGRVTWRKEGRKVIFFPASRMASSPHAIVVMPGSRPRLAAREIREMASRLRQKGYSQPGMYARKLYREGIRLKSRWTEEPGPVGHRAEGGLSRTGRRSVMGVEERLWGPRGGRGSLEETHGFRDARDPGRESAKRRYAEKAREAIARGKAAEENANPSSAAVWYKKAGVAYAKAGVHHRARYWTHRADDLRAVRKLRWPDEAVAYYAKPRRHRKKRAYKR